MEMTVFMPIEERCSQEILKEKSFIKYRCAKYDQDFIWSFPVSEKKYSFLGFQFPLNADRLFTLHRCYTFLFILHK